MTFFLYNFHIGYLHIRTCKTKRKDNCSHIQDYFLSKKKVTAWIATFSLLLCMLNFYCYNCIQTEMDKCLVSISYNWCGLVVERLTPGQTYFFLFSCFKLINWAYLSHFLSDFYKVTTKLFKIACSFNWFVTYCFLLWNKN